MSETKSTCCYCGVGCGVIIDGRRRPRDRRARRSRSSGELRPPVHEGRDAASLGATRHARATTPSCGAAAPRPRSRASWDEALDYAAGRFADDHPRARSRRGRVLHLRPAPYRGLLRLQQARPRAGRHQQRRHQLATLHVLGGRRIQAHARRRRTARLLRGHRPRRPLSSSRLEHRLGASGPVPPDRGRPRADSRGEARRRRPAAHGHRGRGRPPSRDPARHRHRALATRCCTCCSPTGSSIAPTSKRTPRVSRRSNVPCATTRRARPHASAASAPTRSSPRRACSGAPGPRCRSTARGSTSRRTARTTTPRS